VDTNEHWCYIIAKKVCGWVNDYQILHRDWPDGNAVDLDAIRDVFGSILEGAPGMVTGFAIFLSPSKEMPESASFKSTMASS
jgi:hypothetical protein